MMRKTQVITTTTTDPTFNLALESYLLDTLEDDTIILYLWQNQHTIVIGRNQNAYTQVKVDEFISSDGRLVRRLSGGGAVYHDLGNLNFTFIMKTSDFDVAKQSQVILNALAAFGLQGEKSGRNDLLIDGKKFSGNAYYHHQGNSYHHGTLLVNVQMSELSHYLNVSKLKLRSNAVESVKARVTNLVDLNPMISIDSLSIELIEAFKNTYPGDFSIREIEESELSAIHQRQQHFKDKAWIYNPKFVANVNSRMKFSWGECELAMNVINNEITQVELYSDAMSIDFVEAFKQALLTTPYQKEVSQKQLAQTAIESQWQSDLLTLCYEKEEYHD